MGQKKKAVFNGLMNKKAAQQLAVESFESRVGVRLTGLPLTALYKGLKDRVDEKDMPDMLIQLRKVGLRPNEIDAIPEREIEALRNYKETIALIQHITGDADRLFVKDSPKTPRPGKSYLFSKLQT